MGKKWHRFLSLYWRGPWMPFQFMRLSFHLMSRCFVFPQAWGAQEYIRILRFPEGAVLTEYVYWQWLWFQVRWSPEVKSQSE